MIRGEGQTSVTTDKTFIESYKNAHKQYADYLEKKKKERRKTSKNGKKMTYIVTFSFLNYYKY